MPRATAQVSTDAPERYAKQLPAHLGRRNAVLARHLERFGARREPTVTWEGP